MLKLNHRTQAGAAVLFCAMSLMVGFSRTSGGYGRAPSTDFEEKLSARPTNALSALLDDLHGLTETAELPVKKGDSLASLLSSKGVDYAQILDIAKGLEDTMNPNGLRPDSDMLFVKYRPRAGSSPEVLLLEIERSPVYKVIVSASENGWVSREVHIEHQTRLVRRSGRITKGASLIETASQAGIPYNIVDKFYDVFSFDIDFERDIYPGDDFSVMYRERYGPDGRYLGNGELVFASIYLNSRRAELKLYMFEDERGRISYYDEEGRSAVKTLKKTPLNGARVSSRYGPRRHPILGFTRAHQGVDFAAPRGTPVPAGGSGTITFRGWREGYGNYVKIRHNAAYSTAYGHLNAFARGQKLGSRVQQGQTIGYVGSTGLSTGPHLHYEIIKDGVHVNPLSVRLPGMLRLSDADKAKFAKARDRIKIQYAVLDKGFPSLAAGVLGADSLPHN